MAFPFDAQYETYQHYGTNAERLAFTPNPPTATGVQPIYVWYETDTDKEFTYTTGWHQTSSPSGGAPTDATYITQTASGSLSAEQAIGGLASGIMRVANTTGVITSLGDVLPVANGGTGSASGGAILKASVTLTNAEIKALPTTPKLVLAGQGAGFIVVPQFFLIQIRAAAGAYTNIHAASTAFFQTATTNKLVSGYIANDAGTTPVLSQMTQLFGNASNRQLLLTADFFTVNESAGWSTFGDVQVISDLENRNILFAVSNTGGDFTGGNAANTGRIILYYTVETI